MEKIVAIFYANFLNYSIKHCLYLLEYILKEKPFFYFKRDRVP